MKHTVTHDIWGHPLAGENVKMKTNGARDCRHCNICRQRGVRAGQTLEQYYAAHPEAVEYRGFPVAGAKIARPA